MSGGGSFTSDQSVAHATATAQMVAQNRRARLTSIQGKGNSADGSIISSLTNIAFGVDTSIISSLTNIAFGADGSIISSLIL